jgi:hypothetical protein
LLSAAKQRREVKTTNKLTTNQTFIFLRSMALQKHNYLCAFIGFCARKVSLYKFKQFLIV